MGSSIFESVCCIKDKEIIDKYTNLTERPKNKKSIDFPSSRMSFSDKENNDSSKLEYKKEKDIPINTELFITKKIKDPFEDYELIKQIGEGAFGIVYKVKHKVTGAIRALKEIQKLNTIEDDSLQNEILILKKLNHPYIVKLYEFYSVPEKNCYYLVSEFCEEGDLAFKAEKLEKFPEYFVSIIMRQIFQALNYLNKNKVIHGDLKLENILISSFDNNNIPSNEVKDQYIEAILSDAKNLGIEIDEKSLVSKFDFNSEIISPKNLYSDKSGFGIKLNSGSTLSEKFHLGKGRLKFENYRIKITDFGCSKIQTAYRKEFHDTVGTLVYCAPEVLVDTYNEKMDIWACGVIMFKLLTGKLPFDAEDEEKFTGKLINEKIDFFELEKETKISEEAKELIMKCLKKDKDKRITVKEALKSKFITKYESQKEEKQHYTEKEKEILLNFKKDMLDKVDLVELRKKIDKSYLSRAKKFHFHNLEPNSLDSKKLTIEENVEEKENQTETNEKPNKEVKDNRNAILKSQKTIFGFQKKSTTQIELEKGRIIDSKLYQIVLTYLSFNFDDKTILRELTDLFCKIDKKRRGTIIGKDLYKAYEDAGIKTTNEDIIRMMDYIDFDKNGSIEYDEFVRVNIPLKVLFQKKNLKEAFDLLDKDQSKTIVPSEVRDVLGINFKDESKLLDNQSIDFEEFKKKMETLLINEDDKIYYNI